MKSRSLHVSNSGFFGGPAPEFDLSIVLVRFRRRLEYPLISGEWKSKRCYYGASLYP
jgi:hypothetical protein